MKIINLVSASIYIFVALGCAREISDYEKERLHSCIREAEYQVKYLESGAKDILAAGNPEGAKQFASHAKESGVFLEKLKDYELRVLASGKKESYNLPGISDSSLCPFSDFHGLWLRKMELIRSDEAAQRNREFRERWNNESVITNKEIDEAQDSLIKSYEKKAIKHYVSNGSGIKVDTFQLKNGSVVICKTSVTSNGKAVDCH